MMPSLQRWRHLGCVVLRRTPYAVCIYISVLFKRDCYSISTQVTNALLFHSRVAFAYFNTLASLLIESEREPGSNSARRFHRFAFMIQRAGASQLLFVLPVLFSFSSFCLPNRVYSSSKTQTHIGRYQAPDLLLILISSLCSVFVSNALLALSI